MREEKKRGFLLLAEILAWMMVVASLCMMPLAPWWQNLPLFDTSVFLTCSHLMEQGAVMYRDLFDHKGPLVYGYDILGLRLGGMTGVWCLSVLWHGISGWFYYKILRIFTSGTRVARLLTCCVLVMQIWTGGDNSVELMSMPFLLCGEYLLLRALWKGCLLTVWEVFVAFVCLACILLIKPNFAAALVFLIGAALFREIRSFHFGRFLRYGAAGLGGLALVFLPWLGYYARLGALDDLLSCYWTFNQEYSAYTLLGERLHSFVFLFVCYVPSLIWFYHIFVVTACGCRHKEQWPLLGFAWSWLVFTAVLNLGLSGRDFLHYLLPVWPVSILFVLWFWIHPVGKVWRHIGVGLMFLLYAFYMVKTVNSSRIQLNNTFQQEMEEVAAAVRRHSLPSDLICQYEVEPYLYVLAERKPATKYIYQYPPMDVDADLRQDFFKTLASRPPKVLVMPSGRETDFPADFMRLYTLLETPVEDISVYGRIED